jgi:hypothetical protein
MGLLCSQGGESESLGLGSKSSIMLGLLSLSLGFEFCLAIAGSFLGGGDLSGGFGGLLSGESLPLSCLLLGLLLFLLGLLGCLLGKLSHKLLLLNLLLKGSFPGLGLVLGFFGRFLSGFCCFGSVFLLDSLKPGLLECSLVLGSLFSGKLLVLGQLLLVLLLLFGEFGVVGGLFSGGSSPLAGDLIIKSLLGKASFFLSRGLFVSNQFVVGGEFVSLSLSLLLFGQSLFFSGLFLLFLSDLGKSSLFSFSFCFDSCSLSSFFGDLLFESLLLLLKSPGQSLLSGSLCSFSLGSQFISMLLLHGCDHFGLLGGLNRGNSIALSLLKSQCFSLGSLCSGCIGSSLSSLLCHQSIMLLLLSG